ncbi:hypothetical protein [Streptomyces sp. NPDC096311]|uniref:hypothetical protein n=1 Tax=Streptomyces sp. NPDC096311 TaxID=3366083 RepID=UPI00382F31BD
MTVWSEPSRPHRPGVFPLSVTDNGEERYAYTVRGTSVSRRGSVPIALDPDRLFPQDDAHAERLGESRALEALAAEFGVRLPRFALGRGRLHSFRSLALEPAAGTRRGLCDAGRGPRAARTPYAGRRGGMPVREAKGRCARGQG